MESRLTCLVIGAIALAARPSPGSAASASQSTATGCNQPVLVIVDMDAQTPGVQSVVTVGAGSGAGTAIVSGIAVYVIDPCGERDLWSVGYLGGLDRGIAFGHMPSANAGAVAEMSGAPAVPINAENIGWVDSEYGIQPGFAGPEVQYMEFGATSAAAIPAKPAGPIFTVEVTLECAQPGDRFEFFLLDLVTVWQEGGGGAFSTLGPLSLDTGGDAEPDGTQSIYGVDPDGAIPVPPAAFLVDYVDGPAAIEVTGCAGDLDASGDVGFADLTLLLVEWGACRNAQPCASDLDCSGAVGFSDLTQLLLAWGPCG